MLNGGGTNHETAICDRVSKRIELFGMREYLGGGTNGGAGLAKRQVERANDAKAKCAKIAHRARSGAEIQRVPRADEDDAQAVEC